MKDFLIEYAHIVATTILGLLFGLSFFLLFLNFYHYKEVTTTYQPSTENGTAYEQFMKEVQEIKENANTYSQKTYKGQEEVFDMLNMQTKIQMCLKLYETDELKALLTKETYTVNDVYELASYYQNEILNDCIVIQMYNLGSEESSSITSPRLRAISPFLKLEMDQLLSGGLGYLKNNMKNNDIYYFSNDDSKTGVFELTKNSYLEVISYYRHSLAFLKNFSQWYKNLAIGG